MAFRPFLFVGLGLFVVACGSTVIDDGDGGGGSGAGSEGGAGGDIIVGDPCEGLTCGDPCSTCPDGAPCQREACNANGACVSAEEASCSPCPLSLPEFQSACATPDLQCEYDDGIVLACRTRAVCGADGWDILQPNCMSDPPPDPACLPTQPSGACTVESDPFLCVYGATACGCTNCLGGPCGGDAMWVCAPPPEAPCPEIAPRIGRECENEGLFCTYGTCALGSITGGRQCAGGIWTEEGIACPL